MIKEVDQLDWLDKYGAETNQSWIKRANSCLEKDWNDLDAFAPERKAYEEAFKLLFIDNCLLDSRKEAPHRAELIWVWNALVCLLVGAQVPKQSLGVEKMPRSIFQKSLAQIKKDKTMSSPELQEIFHEKETFTDLLNMLYVATANKDVDREMEVLRDICWKFRCRPEAVKDQLYKYLRAKALGYNTLKTVTKKRRNVPLRDQGIDWKLDGFLPANDVSVLWGPRGSGKSTLALEIANSLMNGEALLDREAKPESSKVLFMASDSGRMPLEEELKDLGLSEEFSEHPNWELWCFDQESQQEAWGADLPGMIELYEWAKANQEAVVIQDSAKAICSKGDIDYANNREVTQYMTFLKEVIAPYVTVLVIAHDGTKSGRSGGAGAWEEIPSMVMSCSKPKDEQGKEKSNERIFSITKSRKADERTFFYEKGENGRLKVCQGTQIIADVKGIIFDWMKKQLDEGNEKASVDEVWKAVKTKKPFTSRGTITNNLSTMSRGKTPQLVRAGHKKGLYKINPYYLRSNR